LFESWLDYFENCFWIDFIHTRKGIWVFGIDKGNKILGDEKSEIQKKI